VIVGVNRFVEEESVAPPLLTIGREVEEDQVRRLRAFRDRRDPKAVERARAALLADARESRNLIPAMLDSVEVGVTLGEIVATLKSEYGEHV